MSVNMNRSDDPYQPADQYGEFEYQAINVNNIGDTAGGSEDDEVYSIEPVDLRSGLDPNEMAELVGFRRNFVSTAGAVEFGLGINLSEGEFIEQANTNNTAIAVEDGTFRIVNYNEPGVIDFQKAGAADVPESREDLDSEMVNLRGELGTGPFIDANDDLTIHLEATNETSTNQNFDLNYLLVWDVFELPEGRSRFSLPQQ